MNHNDDSARLADLFHGLNKPALNVYLALSTYKRIASQQSADEADKLLGEYLVELRTILDHQSDNLEKNKTKLDGYRAIYTRYKEQFDEINNILRTIAEGADDTEFDKKAKRLFEIDRENVIFTNDMISKIHPIDK